MKEMNDVDLKVVVEKLRYLVEGSKLLGISEYQYTDSTVDSSGIWVRGGGEVQEALYEELGLDEYEATRYHATKDNEKVVFHAVVVQVALNPNDPVKLAISGVHIINPMKEYLDNGAIAMNYEMFGLVGGYDRRVFELNKEDIFNLPYITYSQGFMKNASPDVKTYLICSDYLEPGFLA